MGIFDDLFSAPAAGAAPSPNATTGAPITLGDPPIWLLPDGSVSYTGRPPSARLPNNAAQAPGGFLGNNAQTLMALGAGIAQGGVGRGLQLAAGAAQASHQQQAQRDSVLHAYDVLTDAGVPRALARAAIYDPHIMRAVASAYFGPKAKPEAPAAVATPAPDAAAAPAPNGPPQPLAASDEADQ